MNVYQQGSFFLKTDNDFRKRVSYDMNLLCFKKPIIARLLAPFTSVGTLVVSLLLRIISVVEPILIGIPYDLIQTCKSDHGKDKSFFNILTRPAQVLDNTVSGLALNGVADVIFIGVGFFTGWFAPKWTYAQYAHTEYNKQFF